MGWALLGRTITGVGTGMAWLANLAMLAVCAPDGRGGRYQAFFATAFSVGSIVTYLLFPHIAAAGWRWVFLTPALVCLLLLALVPLLALPAHTSAGRSLVLGPVLGNRTGWVLGVYHALSYGSMLALGNWVPSLLAEVFGDRSIRDLAWGGALVMLVSGVSRLSGGFLTVLVAPRLVANASVATLCLLFAALTVVSTPGAVLALALLVASFGSVNFGALFHLASRAAPVAFLGTLLGFVNFLGNLGAVAFTLLLGWSKDRLGSFSWGFVVLALLGAAAVVPGSRTLGAVPGSRRPERPGRK
jgi:nitrate/nitrite transporter NarK